MRLSRATGAHKPGPDSPSLQVRTYREGMAAQAGHDLVIDVTRCEATVDIAARSRELDDPTERRLPLAGSPSRARGLKPLTDKDRSEIRKNIDDTVAHGQPITFRPTAMRLTDGDAPLTVEGDLTMASSTRGAAERDSRWPCQRDDSSGAEHMGHQAPIAR
jgi:hypothetical protein